MRHKFSRPVDFHLKSGFKLWGNGGKLRVSMKSLFPFSFKGKTKDWMGFLGPKFSPSQNSNTARASKKSSVYPNDRISFLVKAEYIASTYPIVIHATAGGRLSINGQHMVVSMSWLL